MQPRLLEQFADQADREQLAKGLISQMGDYAEQIAQLRLRLEDLTRELEDASRQRQEQRPKGLGHLSLEKMRREVCDWNRFANRRQVATAQ